MSVLALRRLFITYLFWPDFGCFWSSSISGTLNSDLWICGGCSVHQWWEKGSSVYGTTSKGALYVVSFRLCLFSVPIYIIGYWISAFSSWAIRMNYTLYGQKGHKLLPNIHQLFHCRLYGDYLWTGNGDDMPCEWFSAGGWSPPIAWHAILWYALLCNDLIWYGMVLMFNYSHNLVANS